MSRGPSTTAEPHVLPANTTAPAMQACESFIRQRDGRETNTVGIYGPRMWIASPTDKSVPMSYLQEAKS